MMGNRNYSKEQKAKSFLKTLWLGLKVIGKGLLIIIVLSAISMGFVIAFADIIGKLTFEWWHLVYWIIDVLGCAFLIGIMFDDD